jgi:rhodanese-related sulfurtransferase
MKHISVHAFKQVLSAEEHNDSVAFINVCSPTEYAESHIAGVENIPLDSITTRTTELKDKQTIYVHCRSGNRSKRAIQTLASLGVTAELVNVEGGLLAWDDAGFDTQTITKKKLPIMRQVFIVAGALIVLSQMLVVVVHPNWNILSAFVGIGLLIAGITGWCGMYQVLRRMPWNN